MAKSKRPPDPRQSVHFKAEPVKIALYRQAARVLFHGDGNLSMFLRRAADKLADDTMRGAEGSK